MPAKDRLHDLVVRALQKEGWQVEEQVTLLVGERFLWINLRAINAQSDLIVLIEIKGFEAPSQIEALATAIGKYVLYRAVLETSEISIPLYLAVPLAAYEGILSEAVGTAVLEREQVKLVVFDPTQEEIVQWIAY